MKTKWTTRAVAIAIGMCASAIVLVSAAPPEECDIYCLLEILIADVAKLREEAGRNAYAVWKPGRGCWAVHERCERLRNHRSFASTMTGPAGRLHIAVQTNDGGESLVLLDPNDVWTLRYPDQDGDGDIDLKDFALLQGK